MISFYLLVLFQLSKQAVFAGINTEDSNYGFDKTFSVLGYANMDESFPEDSHVFLLGADAPYYEVWIRDFLNSIPQRKGSSMLQHGLQVELRVTSLAAAADTDKECMSILGTSAGMCLRHLAPIRKDRSCLLFLPHKRERETSRFIGEYSNNEVNNIIADSVGITLSSLSFLNATMERYTVQSNNQLCSRINASEMTEELFLRSFWTPQRPVVVSKLFNPLPLDDLLSLLYDHGNDLVGTKLSPDENFEGIDLVSNWEGGVDQFIPQVVLDQLESPDLVVVRNAHEEFRIRDVLSLIREKETNRVNCEEKQRLCGAFSAEKGNHSCTATALKCSRSASMYVEYLDMTRSRGLYELYLTLLKDAQPFPGWMNYFIGNSSYEARAHHRDADGKPMLWLGDGRTVGKLHFDPFDNVLFQVEGTKTFRLSDPENNARFYEGHMREAQLEVEIIRHNTGDICVSGGKDKYEDCSSLGGEIGSTTTFVFRKTKLLEATSMVHSPIDVNNINIERFPISESIRYMDCEVGPGEALFVPSFWWHEVYSRPSTKAAADRSRLNIAVNFWYPPLYNKEFPCASCKKNFNSDYSSLVRSAAQKGLL